MTGEEFNERWLSWERARFDVAVPSILVEGFAIISKFFKQRDNTTEIFSRAKERKLKI